MELIDLLSILSMKHAVFGHFVALQEYLWYLSHFHGNMVFWLVLLSNLRLLLLLSSKVCSVKSITCNYTDGPKM